MNTPQPTLAEQPTPPRSRWRTIRDTAGAAVGAILGVVPHVLHHIGLLTGAVFVTTASGNVILFAIGLLLSVPMLRRLYRHVGSWWAPALAVAAFTALFSLSAFVIGPAISGNDGSVPPSPSSPSPTHDHDH